MTNNQDSNQMNISQKLLAGIKDPRKIEMQNQLNVETRRGDTLGMYARAAARTFAETGRESCLGAQARYETAQIAAKERALRLAKALGELV